MKLKHMLAGLALVAPMVASAATFTFVGSWQVDQGQHWTNNPAVFSGQEAAAFLFGGKPTDYAISIVNDVNNVTHTAWYDGWGVHNGDIANNVFSESFHKDTGGFGYNSQPGTGSAFSSFVNDGLWGAKFTNYAYRVAAPVPEPETYALMGMGLVGLLAARRRKVKQA